MDLDFVNKVMEKLNPYYNEEWETEKEQLRMLFPKIGEILRKNDISVEEFSCALDCSYKIPYDTEFKLYLDKKTITFYWKEVDITDFLIKEEEVEEEIEEEVKEEVKEEEDTHFYVWKDEWWD